MVAAQEAVLLIANMTMKAVADGLLVVCVWGGGMGCVCVCSAAHPTTAKHISLITSTLLWYLRTVCGTHTHHAL